MFKPLERHIAQELAVQQVFRMHLVQLPLFWFPFPDHCFQLDLLTSGIHGGSGKRQELGILFFFKFEFLSVPCLLVCRLVPSISVRLKFDIL